jgi:hypothetical protein
MPAQPRVCLRMSRSLILRNDLRGAEGGTPFSCDVAVLGSDIALVLGDCDAARVLFDPQAAAQCQSGAARHYQGRRRRHAGCRDRRRG